MPALQPQLKSMTLEEYENLPEDTRIEIFLLHEKTLRERTTRTRTARKIIETCFAMGAFFFHTRTANTDIR
ncbi:MAG: hypothetical protein LUI87_01460 [Lachnospiraceae bacterium]|nr:hypothetical protein [Lachnospiraceae bacterium]